MTDTHEKSLEQVKDRVTNTDELQNTLVSSQELPLSANSHSAKENTNTTTNEENKAMFTTNYNTKEEVIERLKEIASNEETPQKEEIDLLKSAFYRLHLAEREAEQKAFIEAGGAPEDYKALPSESEQIFKAELSLIKEKRAKYLLKLEEEKKENLTKKLAIIEAIKEISTSPDVANKSYNHFKELQQQWKEIKAVPADKANDLWRNYHLYTEQFYDLLKLNNEAREYDFKKNLELKTKLCELAEALNDEKDVISASAKLQELHHQYREIGPVAKELREEVWLRFKNASTVINKKHQAYFETLRAKEADNLEKKTALCERLEALNTNKSTTINAWEAQSKEVLDIQKEWKTIGYATQKMNVKIFERFRKACDEFFENKAMFFKDMKDTFAINIEKKKKLIETAKQLVTSTDWNATGEKFIRLQKEWKTIGHVPRKTGDKLWEEFNSTCNKFFDARKEAGADAHENEHKNLERKQNIVQQLKTFVEEKAEDVQDKVLSLMKEYNNIGHVPYKEKDKIYAEYQEVIDLLKKELNISIARKRLDAFKNNLKKVVEQGENALESERNRLFRAYERITQELKTYENNLGFFNASSKKGNSLVDEMNRKINKLKDEIELLKNKIKEIDKQLTEEMNDE
jgi:hypothetical protein